MDIIQLLNIPPDTDLEIFLANGDGEYGKFNSIDLDGRTLSLLCNESDTVKTIALDEIVQIGFADVVVDPMPPKTIEDELREIPIGKYLMIWGNYGNAINETIEQGKLKSIDWNNRTLILASTTYPGRQNTVKFDQITWIDTSRAGSGALSAVQTPDWIETGMGEWTRPAMSTISKATTVKG